MENIRDGTVSVYCLKLEVRKSLSVLKSKGVRSKIGNAEYMSRLERQIQDGERFLLMLNGSSYATCKTVDELKQRITKKRNSLKKELIRLDPNAAGHQITIFEMVEESTEEERKARENLIKDLKEEIHWLHKCLGICKNRDYFK